MAKGLFITFEGGEGSGKSTQIKRIQTALEGQGRQVIVTREPGGTPEAEKIRTLLVQRDGGDWSPVAECLLLFAARAMHVETLINPSLAAGKIVLCDRFTDSTRAYQGYGKGLDLETIETFSRLALGDCRPDLTFILDLPVQQGLQRAITRMGSTAVTEDRFERLDLAFHERMREGYLSIAKAEPERCRVIEAGQGADAVTALMLSHIGKRLAHV
jgi:dTMP kinase